MEQTPTKVSLFFGSEKFYYGIDLVELFLDLLSSKSSEIISEVYSEIEVRESKRRKASKNRCNRVAG